ncbi:MAG: SDR family oxidoreductase [Bacteroidia bacterium]|nr:SDR family oxidoreductase [Bacteroidia bacterium]MDW8133656.1 SDR family oxidoreductase [Bacteroidia bacterium]
MAVAVITGVTRGIGYSIAQKFEKAYTIVGCGRNPERVKAISELHPTWDISCYNLANKEEAFAFADYILGKYVDLDILINNAGSFSASRITDETDSIYEEMIAINLHSAYYLTKRMLPRFLAQKRGLIINIASTASLTAYPKGSAYSIAKAALLSLSRNLRLQLMPHGIRVSALILGATYTDSWKGTPHASDRFISPEAVAELLWCIAHLPSQAVVEEIIMRPLQGDILDT